MGVALLGNLLGQVLILQLQKLIINSLVYHLSLLMEICGAEDVRSSLGKLDLRLDVDPLPIWATSVTSCFKGSHF